MSSKLRGSKTSTRHGHTPGKTLCSRVALATGLALLASAFACAEETAHDGESHGHAEHKNVFALFVGAATEERRDKGPAIGLEYERRLNTWFGIGVLAERTFGDLDSMVYAIPFAYHSGAWKAYIAPGIEDREGHEAEDFVRIGAEYAFEAGSWEIAPQVDLDFVEGSRVFVIGVTFGKGF
jgi:hypothetical protein